MGVGNIPLYNNIW